MRLALTIVSPRMRWSADIVLDADPAAPVAEFAAALAGFGYDSRPVRAEMLPGPRSSSAAGACHRRSRWRSRRSGTGRWSASAVRPAAPRR